VAARVYNLVPFQWQQEYFRVIKDDMDLPIVDLSIIVKVTDKFSSGNKLGQGGLLKRKKKLREGGFGPVYKVT
jgi:hypothetical protein